MKKEVTVLMPVFNAEKYVRESIQSILDQSYKSWLLLICDDASSDGSAEILQSFNDSRIKFIQNPANIGYLRSINKLFDLADTELIAFQDADDLSHPDRLYYQVKALGENPDAAICGTNYSLIDPKSEVVKSVAVETDPAILKKRIEVENCFQKPSIMFRREILKTVGGYREQFLELENISEDYDWLLRISEKYPIININHDESLYLYRSVPTAMSKRAMGYRQLLGHQVAQFLHRQRIETGTDFLMTNEVEKVMDYIRQIELPYLEDRSLFYRERAGRHLSFGLPREAATYAIKAVLANPSNFLNYRILRFSLLRLAGRR